MLLHVLIVQNLRGICVTYEAQICINFCCIHGFLNYRDIRRAVAKFFKTLDMLQTSHYSFTKYFFVTCWYTCNLALSYFQCSSISKTGNLNSFLFNCNFDGNKSKALKHFLWATKKLTCTFSCLQLRNISANCHETLSLHSSHHTTPSLSRKAG
jgi:hypothetical protein